jgi:hypothetical protein
MVLGHAEQKYKHRHDDDSAADSNDSAQHACYEAKDYVQ